MPRSFRLTFAHVLTALLLVVLAGCATAPAPKSESSAPIETVFLQLNDVYEIGALSGGQVGGLARVKTLKQQSRAQHPNTYLVLAGDFVSPSAIGSAVFDPATKAQFAGRQMIDVLNVIGLDVAVFGNHEFDIGTDALQQRIGEARFTWLAGNVRAADGATPYARLPPARILIANTPRRTLRIGVVAATMETPSTKTPAQFDDPIESVGAQIRALEADTDMIVALTHLPIAQDRALAQRYPQLVLIMGGHEHSRHAEAVGSVHIAKADSNARTVGRHVLRYDPTTKATTVTTEFVPVDATIAEDPEALAAVQRWTDQAGAAFAQSGIDVRRVVTTLEAPLDGLSDHVRHRQTDLGTLIGKALLPHCPDARVALFNSGAIRVDDMVGPGEITEYDVLRIAPFEDKVACANVRGGDLKAYVDAQIGRRGTGEFPQLHGIAAGAAGWTYADGSAIPDDAIVPIAANNYVVRRMQPAPVEGSIVEKGDLRRAVIDYMRAGGR